MKKLFSMLFLSASLFTQAQYQQSWFNHAAARVEHFEDGIRTKNNFALPVNPYYVAAAGVSFGVPLAPIPTYNRARFTRLLTSGAIPSAANFSYEFSIPLVANSANASANSICEIAAPGNNGGYILTGKVSHAALTGGSDALMFNVSNLGVASNQTAIDLGGAEEAMCIKRSVFNPNTYLICGYTTYTLGLQSYTEPFLLNVTNTGVINWVTRFSADIGVNIIGITKANYLCEDPGTGDVYVVGTYKDEAPLSRSAGFIFKTNSAGILQWQNKYEDPAIIGDVEFHSIKRNAVGEYIVAGWSSENGGITTSDMVFMKVNNLGAITGQNLFRVNTGGVNIASKAFDIVERFNMAGQAEYFLTGPTIIGGVNTNVVNYKLNYTAAAFEHYVYAYGIGNRNEHGYAIDFTPNASPNPGILTFSSVTTAARPGLTDGYFLRTTFNGCTCTDFCPAVVRAAIPSNMNVVNLNTVPRLGSNTRVLAVNRFNCIDGMICNENLPAIIAAGGSNARLTNLTTDENLTENTIKDDFIAYPNPLESDVLWVKSDFNAAAATSIQLFNLNGELIKDYGFVTMEPSDVLELSFNEFSNGIYMLKLQTDNAIITKRIVKK